MRLQTAGLRALHFIANVADARRVQAFVNERPVFDECPEFLRIECAIDDLFELGLIGRIVSVADRPDEQVPQRLVAKDLAQHVKNGATEAVSRVLNQHGVLGFVADQNAGRKGIFVDFFGRKASTYKSIGLLAMEYEIPVVIGYARRLDNKFCFRVAAQDIIYPEDWRDQPDPLRYITQRYIKAIEDMVRDDPTQYLWMHRRWKTRPKGEVAMKYD